MKGAHAYMITLFHPATSNYRLVPTGFSWTTLFFGFLPALFRNDIKWAAIQFAVAILTSGLSVLAFPFFYNKLHLDDLLKDGWVIPGTPQAVVSPPVVNVTVNS